MFCKTTSIEGDEVKPVLCTLRNPSLEQTNLSLVFGYDVPVSFYITGDSKAVVYLSGYFQPGPEDGEDDGEDVSGFPCRIKPCLVSPFVSL